MTGKTSKCKKAGNPKLVLHRQFPNEVDYVDDELFHQRKAKRVLFGPDSEKIDVPLWKPPESLERALELAQKTLLTNEQQQMLFLQFNYARYRVSKMMKKENRLQRRFMKRISGTSGR